MNKELKKFKTEIDALKLEMGEQAAVRAYLVFAKAIFWLRHWGHGDLTISAINRKFGPKIIVKTVISINEDLE